MMMIFCNGLILTIVAFVMLVFYTESARERAFQSNIDYMNNSIEETITQTVTIFDLLSSLPEDNQSAVALNEGLTKNIHAIDLVRLGDDNSVLSRLYGQDSSSREEIAKIVSIANASSESIGFYTSERGFYAYKKGSTGDIKIGRLSQNIFQGINNAIKNRGIHSYKVFDAEFSHEIYDYQKPLTGNRASANDVAIQDIRSINLFGHPFEVMINLTQDSPVILGEKLPFIVVIFGFIMTIIGTLFVRNNQKQAYQISMMNNILEDKNVTLENKIKEAQEHARVLKENEAEYQAVVNSVQDVLFEIDMTGRITFLNKAWKNMTSQKPKDAYGEDFFKFFHDDYQDQLKRAFFDFEKALLHEAVSVPAKLDSGSGVYRNVNVVFSVMRNSINNIPHIIGTIKDVEKQMQAEKALDEVEKRYSKIVENAAGGIYQIGPDGSLMSANPSFARILGYNSPDEMRVAKFNINDIYLDHRDRQNYEAELLKHNTIRQFEVQVRHRSGRKIWINENARLIRDDNNNIQYYEGSIEDITKRKQAEIELIEAKVDSDLASRAKSEFLANMSHELRTPLNSVIGFSEIIKSEALGEIQQKAYVDYARDIHDSGTRLLGVINEILGISKIEAGERQLNETVLDLSKITQTCVDLLSSKIESHKVHVTNLIKKEIPNIIGEELAFKQILMNLLSNAVKFTPEGGSIAINAELVEGDVILSITDTGIGIDEVDIPKAMSPFGQLDNSLTRSNSGTGLGLTLVNSLVRLHQGRLEMVSQKGIGTTVIITIPEKRVAVKKVKSEERDKSNIANLNDYKK